MKAPKILPWIAKKTSISEQLALNLWRRAAGEAEEMVGDCHSDNYYHLAVKRFINLCEAESEKKSDHEIPLADQFGWLRRHQERVVQLNIVAARNTCLLWIDNWNNFLAQQKVQ